MTRTLGLLHANEELATRLDEMVEEYVEGWEVEKITSRLDTLAHIRALDKAAQARTGYDLLQVDTLVGPGPIAQLASWLGGTPVVGYLRGWGDYTNYHGQYGWRKRNRIRAKTRLQLRTYDGMAGISHALVAGMSNMYPMGNTRVIERPYNVAKYANGEAVTEKNTVRVSTVTNLRYEEKRDGVITCVKAMQPLIEEHPELEYCVYGGGRHYGAIQDLVDGKDRIRAPGFVEDIPDVLAETDIFVYVSFLDGSPSTVYEAQSAGVPVIGGDAAGVPEAVGDAGIICPPTEAGVRESVRALLDDPNKRRRLGNASHQKMQNHNQRVAKDWQAYWEANV